MTRESGSGRAAVPIAAGALLLWAAWSSLATVPAAAEEWRRWETPEEAGFSSQRIAGAEAYWYALDDAPIAASFIVFKGRVLAEFGDAGFRFWCHSVRKSFLSALYGIHVDNGNIDLQMTLEELGIDDDPPLTDEEKRARVIDLIRARSGVYHEAACESQGMKDARPQRGSHAPGTFWYYNNWDFNALGTIFRQETGRDIFEEFADRIAGPIGMQDFAASHCQYQWQWEYSIHPCYTFRMSARDRARFGQLFLQNGRWGDRQIIPTEWVEESTRKHSSTGDRAVGYGYMWWTLSKDFFRLAFPFDHRLHHLEAFTASGYGGQLIFVIPDADMVLVTGIDVPLGGDLPLGDVLPMWRTILTAREAVDLSVRRAKIKPSSVAAGGRARVAVKVKNLGDERSARTGLDLYLSPSPALGGDARWIGEMRLGRIPVGGRRTARLEPPIPGDLPPGDYHLIAALDRRHANYDLNRDNNLGIGRRTIEIR